MKIKRKGSGRTRNGGKPLVSRGLDKKGFFFTLAIVLLIIPVILLVVYYSGISKTKVDDASARLRCDELHYFVEDIKVDLSRSMFIFGRRAAIYAINDEIGRAHV